MKIVVLTSTGIRHRYFAGVLARHFDVVTVFCEEKQFRPDQAYKNESERKLVARWFEMRDSAERRFFLDGAAEADRMLAGRIERLEPGAVNDSRVLELVRRQGAELGAVFGSSLIRAPLLEALGGRAVNLHLGLSPYYRGSGTNFWPFFNGELQFVGATIHWLDTGIDSGPILHQIRPQISPDDDPHTIGCKTIVSGTERLAQTLEEISSGRAHAIPQRHDIGRLYKRKDFGPEHVAEVFRRLDEGLIPRYCEHPIGVEIVD